MNINDLTIGQAKELAAMFYKGSVADTKPAQIHPYAGKTVIVRTFASGVHCATLVEYDYQYRTAILSDSKRIWDWTGAFTLSAVASTGVKTATISRALDEFFVTQVEEIIPMSDIAIQSINNQGVHNE